MKKSSAKCYLCESTTARIICVVNKRPAGETDYGISPENYQRVIAQCEECGVFLNRRDTTIENFYAGAYMASTYQDRIREKFDKISALPVDQSDNKQRVYRIRKYLEGDGVDPQGLRVLDIGSGLGIFPAELKKHGPIVSCIDPDQKAIDHLVKYVGIVDAYTGLFEEYQFSEHTRFDLITFNKILEHVVDPTILLKKASTLLSDAGQLYIEVPDAENALRNGSATDREEFYLEHYLVFTRESFEYMVRRAGLEIGELTSIEEPSDKYTLVGWLSCG
jgi:SAM-dependent methyltransferase